MTQPLNEFISTIRLAESIEQERFLIATEQAHIRAYLRNCDSTIRPRIIMKLLFLEILGHNNAWCQMEVLTLMSEEQFSFKRLGYIAGAILLDETSDLTVLVTQTLLKDLQSNDPNIQCLALAFIANVGSPEVCRAVAATVQKTIETQNSAVMKRAGMAIVHIVRNNPDLAETFKNSVQKLLNHTNHGVVLSGMNMVISLIQVEPRLAKLWSQFAGPFTRILKSLSTTRGTREFTYGVFNDPYMQIKAMLALTLLKKPSDELDSILQSIVSSTETRRNTGRAVLYQAVELVVAVSQTPSLRGLAFNQVGRLLSMKDPNVLYSALSVFARVLYTERDIINRGSVDTQALQRYKKHIVRCLDHRDPSIRRRALDVVSALIDENNVETLVPEIITFVRLADNDFRCELITKIYAATQRFAPNKEWNFDTVHQLLVDSGNYVSAEIITDFCDFITKSPEIQQHAVKQLTASMIQFTDNQALMQVSAYVVGEFAMADNGAFDNLKQIVALPQTTNETKFYIIMAIGKLAARLGKRQEAAELMDQLRTSNDIEVQQRAGEVGNILRLDGLCEEFLAPVSTPSSEEAPHPTAITTMGGGKQENLDAMLIDVVGGGSSTPANTAQNAVADLLGTGAPAAAPQQQQAPHDDLLDILGPSKPATTSTAINAAADLLSMPPAQPQQQQQQQAPMAPLPPPPGMSEVMKTNDFVIYGQTKANPQNPQQIALRIVVISHAPKELTEFKLEYNIARGWKLMVQPPDGNKLAPVGGKPISQTLFLLNEVGAPFGLQIRTNYRYGSQPLTETGTLRMLI